jgi:hypothetical protein
MLCKLKKIRQQLISKLSQYGNWEELMKSWSPARSTCYVYIYQQQGHHRVATTPIKNNKQEQR